MIGPCLALHYRIHLANPPGKQELVDSESIKDRDIKEGDMPLDHLVEDPIIMRDKILNIMITGHDTIAATMIFVIHMLAQHPDVLRRLCKEILSKVGSSRRLHPTMPISLEVAREFEKHFNYTPCAV
ncbi:hypothetical protein F4604DRAFT_1920096 [Suillus subluteus]|nr:hypothetical protein F4604DRAFT_1920096 [Suillus subluteus]